VGVAVHWASVGRTALQPAKVGVAVHWAKVGSTTLQPGVVGAAVHWANVGNTELQPGNVGVAIHWASVGGGAVYRFGDCVTAPVRVPPTLIAPPADNPIVAPETLPLTVSVLFEAAYVPLEVEYPAFNATASVAVIVYPEPTVNDPAAVSATEDPLMLRLQSHDCGVPVLSEPPEVTPTAPVAEM
jgi:hypothetical protein